jgi:hypothetical protein
VITPAVVIRPIFPEQMPAAEQLPLDSVNHSAPSGPLTIPSGLLLAVGTGYKVNMTDGADGNAATVSITLIALEDGVAPGASTMTPPW